MSENMFTECPGCGTKDAPVRTENQNAVAFQCPRCSALWITDKDSEPEILPPKPTVDRDLRTKLEALAEEFSQESAKYSALMYSADHNGWHDYFDGVHTVYEITFRRLRQLLAEDSTQEVNK